MRAVDVRFDVAAYAELLETQAWYAHRGPEAARKFLEAVEEARLRIAEGPERWPRSDEEHRKVRVVGFPYSLVYLPEERPVRIVAVAHAARNPGYWMGRR